MEVVETGHIYKLANKQNGHQTLAFFKDLRSGGRVPCEFQSANVN